MMVSATRIPSPDAGQRLAERARPHYAAVMRQRWEHLAFLHWRFDPELIQRSLPRGLTVDPWDGAAWVGLVPIFMRGVRPRFVPPIPYVSDFLELNLRTYVYDASGRPGVYFYSLACDQPLVVETARGLLGLNYTHAAMSGEVDRNGRVTLACRPPGGKVSDLFVYRASEAPPHEAAPDTLEFFLIERYRLFAAGHRDRLTSIRVYHAPYRIRDVNVLSWGKQSFAAAGLPIPAHDADHVCAADTVDLEVFLPEPVEKPAAGPELDRTT
jgi:uncharacterized protein YqjF (DUF2071 family)